MYSNETLDYLRENNNLKDVISNYVNLKLKGNSYFGLCPFHNEKSPSFSVSDDKQLFHCFGCGASGNVFTFIMMIENYDFVDAVKFLADRVNYTLEESNVTTSEEYKKKQKLKDDLLEIHKISARLFYDILQSDNGEHGRNYLDDRKMANNIRRKFGIGLVAGKKNVLYDYLLDKGFNNETILKSGLVIERNGSYFDRFWGRIMFPIFDVQNKIVGFGGRAIQNQDPKYLNSPETMLFNKSKILYNLNYARKASKEELILVEGYMDVISMYQNGFQNVVATMGTAFNNEHANVLKRYAKSVIILFDSDEAGVKATLKVIPILTGIGIKVKVLTLKEAKDPDEFLNKYGNVKLAEALQNADSYIMFQIKLLKEKYTLDNPQERVEFIGETVNILKKIDSEFEIEIYINEITKLTGVSEISIKNEINKNKNVQNIQYKKSESVVIKSKNNQKISQSIKSIINVISFNTIVREKVKIYLKEEHLLDDTYSKVLSIIYSSSHEIKPDEIVSNFYDIEEQKQVSSIFNTALEFSEIKDIERSLNHHLKTILENYINVKIKSLKDPMEIQSLINFKREVNNIYIKYT